MTGPTRRGPRAGLDVAMNMRPQVGLAQVLDLLPVPAHELADRVAQELVDNPSLVRRAGSPCPGCGRHVVTGRCSRCPAPTRPDPEPHVDVFAQLEVAVGCEVRSDSRFAVPLVLAHLTDRGLLDAAPASIASQHALTPSVVAEVLRAIEAAGPPGIASESLIDLLVAQATALVEAGCAPAVLVAIVAHHLADLAADEPGKVATALSAPVRLVADAFRVARTQLRPFVDWRDRHDADRVVADVLVYRRADGGVDVEVPDSDWYGLAVDDPDPRLRANAAAAAWLAPHEAAAHALLRRLDLRASIVRRVAVAALTYQADYLERGPDAHRDLTRAALAERIGIHPSTVSRAVAGKTLRLPDRRFLPFADLFGTAVSVKAQIATLAAAGGLSDERIRCALARQGHRLARRTVAKYRAQSGLPPGGR